MFIASTEIEMRSESGRSLLNFCERKAIILDIYKEQTRVKPAKRTLHDKGTPRFWAAVKCRAPRASATSLGRMNIMRRQIEVGSHVKTLLLI